MESSGTNSYEEILKKNYPEYVRREIHIPERSVYSVLEETAKKYPNNISLDFIGKKWTYSEFKASVDRAANFLFDQGVRESSRVGLMVPNSPQYAILFFAILKLGAIVVQVNPLYTAYEVKEEMDDSSAETLIVLDDFFPKVQNLVPTSVSKIIVTRIKDYLPGFIGSIFSLSRKLKKEDVEIEYTKQIVLFGPNSNGTKELGEEKVDPKMTPAVIQYTGGTTGIPKGALLSHYNLISNMYMLEEWVPEKMKKDLDFLSAIPFFHVYGMMTALLLPVFLGSRIIIVPDPRDTERLLKTIGKEKNIVFPGIPTMYHSILRSKLRKKYDLSGISLLLSGAAPLPNELEEEFTQRTKGSIIEGYGLTETSPVVCATPIDRTKKKIGSVGFPIPNTQVRIMDAETGDKEMPFGEPGEIAVKGPQVMMGYLNKKKETEDTIKDGWLYTGDIGLIDEEGYIHIVDRKKDVIIAGGYNIYPREIEEILYKNPKIEEAAVIGVPDPHRGEDVKAFIVLKKGEKMTDDEVKKFCLKYLAIYKIPRIIEFRESLPKSIVGKVLKKELRKESV
ncbi:long-chain-fatty-acid--CoA ligase [Cuniculiplasma sp. SKW3]|uniref:long-chain-fatty-acid--CoA ligase n=1 Tax=Cuniculiplasma sp. SKW3 TaxID=3400170 RepID=UPI003FD4DD6C